jgi:predicted tellurium resistance membrane protein TerC/glutathione S-transferase
MAELLLDPHAWIALATLTALELVLGIDNIVFISILVDKLPAGQQRRARLIGLFLAMFLRVGLLLVLAWIIGLTAPLFGVLGREVSGRDLILIGGGLFLLWKSTHEIHASMEGGEGDMAATVKANFAAVIVQIMIVDMVFSLDSIITAVGMVDRVEIMITAVVASVALMMVFAGAIGRFVNEHPTVKMLALSFLVVVGVALIVEGCGQHVPKGYIYFAMAFSLGVEMLNIRMRKRAKTRSLRPGAGGRRRRGRAARVTTLPAKGDGAMSTDRRIAFFHSPRTRSSGVLALLEELGADYELHLLDFGKGEQRQPAYLAVNPMGKVPAIVHQGALVTEQGAIVTYLADLYSEAGIAPAIGDPLRGPYLRWLFFHGSAFEPALVDRALKREPAPPGTSPYGDYETMLKTLLDQLGDGPWLLGERFTAADVLWGSALRWTTMFKLVPQTPAVQAYVERVTTRPAALRAAAKDAEIVAARGA